MAQSVWDRLGEQPVPRQPLEFRRRLHERINARLVVVHVLEAAVGALPFACLQFLSAIGGAVIFSFTGRFPHREGDDHAE
jgi:hypothetical protein